MVKPLSICLLLAVGCPVWMPASTLSQSVRWEGQASVWGIANDTDSINAQLAAHYITGLGIERRFGPSVSADIYTSAHAYLESHFNHGHLSRGSEEVSDVELYRCYARLTLSNSDLRIGLQRLNFGSAVLLRPLRWFDGLDPRDPMRFSEGVYGILLRTFLNNNANLWLWGLYGNDEVKGWEILPTTDRRVEWGGRLQYPIYAGELAFTYHQRAVDMSRLLRPGLPAPADSPTEHRYAFDMRWDIEIGLWSEFVVVDRNGQFPLSRWQRFINLGADYTIGIGNGIRVTGEYFEVGEPPEPLGSSNPEQLVAGSIDYVLGIADGVRCILYRDLSRRDSYTTIAWTHTLDNWQFSLNGFWNPTASFLDYDSGNMMIGKGIQITATFNH